ncbi:MAG: helix-turn-helix domain-containing protein [Chthoniobacteraceae bacterium]
MFTSTSSTQRSKEVQSVALLIETSTQWGRGVISGIKHYIEKHQKWHVFIEPHGSNEVIHLPTHWQGEGIIADIHHSESVAELKKLHIPVVNVSDSNLPGCRFPRVTGDVRAAARMAAEYYFERGYKHLAYICLNENDTQKCDAFHEAVEALGCTFHSYAVTSRGWGVPDWNLSLPNMAEWLRSLPKPVGIVSWAVGHEVIEACRMANLIMPSEVALLMFSYDDIFLEMPEISLSGVLPHTQKIGFEAAMLLQSLMDGARPPAMDILIDPLGINSRMSTDALAAPDSVVIKALNYIYTNVSDPFGVGILAEHVGVSRRILENRFMAVCHRTPADYIRSVHMDRAKELLRETRLSIPDVAQKSGFTSPDYMGFAFKKETGMTPLNYRKQMSFAIPQ